MLNYIIRPLNLHKKRKSKKLTQKDLAGLLGLTEFHVLRIEKGQKGMSFKTALKCVQKFGQLDFLDEENGMVYTIERKPLIR